MNKTDRIVVIGAGLSGLTVARMLADDGRDVVVCDKSRGLGGRMASRRKDGWRFDHGAVVLRPTEGIFANFITQIEGQGTAAYWTDAKGWTGLPGMSGSVKPIANGLTICTQAEITALDRGSDGWSLQGHAEFSGQTFDQLVLAIPQPQAHRLVSPWPKVQAQIEHAKMAPCWTLMAGFDAPLPTDVTYINDCAGPISVIAREIAKPGRTPPGDAWVIQANAEWSTAHLEYERAEIESLLLQAFFAALDCPPVSPVISMAHRWRYALTSQPLGQPCLTDEALGLSICGDWCLGATAQDAFMSGRSLAETLLSE
ncbi:NAD(P)/FAD-dependent oxidoreductase [Tateyamaria sp. syn59]|uniref:NAD(P)/FAD-dependent oxidoreductase n=1 Tax=Tateyamaria sp. syn59 TaxID=2576942 RepID=UPI0011BF2603|nr:FAD-dependent oxidoreductase [Tateyamaria sp. syn59]